MMEDIRFIAERPDGGVSITQLAPKWVEQQKAAYLGKRKEFRPGEFDHFIALLAQQQIPRAVPGHVAYKRISKNDLPADRYFRNAWEIGVDKPVKVNLANAQQIHMNEIRRARDKRLTELDKRKYGAEYDAERQTLRDIPQTFDLTKAKNPEELKALWPQELDEHR